MFRRRSRDDAETPSDCAKQRQTLLWSGLTVALGVQSEQTRHPSLRQLSHAQYFMQDMTHAVFEMHTVSAISRTFNRRFANTRSWIFFTLGSRFRGTWAWLIKNRRATTLKLVKPILDGRNRRRRVAIHNIQALFDFAARFPLQIQESNYRPILIFSIFVKSADTPVSTRGQNKATSSIRLKFWQ